MASSGRDAQPRRPMTDSTRSPESQCGGGACLNQGCVTHLPRHHDDKRAAPVALYVGRRLPKVAHKLGEVPFRQALLMVLMGGGGSRILF